MDFRAAGRRLAAFATDLDRTLMAPGGWPGRIGRRALRSARAMGLRTLLVTGRRYSESRRFADAFGEFDGIVAENGAVVEAPMGAAPTIKGRRTAATVRPRLEEDVRLLCEFGEVVVSVPRSERLRLLQCIKGLPVRVVANVDRLMVLPQGVDKRTGVRTALRQLGLAQAPYAAIGDAENDLALLAGARFSGAVANAEPEVRRHADYVCRARYERGVLEFVLGPLARRTGGRAPETPLNGGGT